MKKLISLSIFLCGLTVMGCAEPVATTPDAGPSTQLTAPVASDPGDGQVPAATIESGTASLTPENTKIQFVGTHVGDEPNPRTGGFEQFAGKAEVDTESNTLKSVSVEIQTESIWTQIERLTNHLKSPDFFNAREYPTAKFESNKIAAGGSEGQHTVTGNLTLLETTKEISFPATVNISDNGLSLSAEFSIDRTQFGMDYGPDRVENEVSLAVVVGEKTQPLPPQEAGGGGSGRGGGRGDFDPTAFFERSDADGDGKLTGDEISERMRERMDDIDTDGDGAITLKEFQDRPRGGGGRGPGGGRAAGDDDPSAGEDEGRPKRPQRPQSE